MLWHDATARSSATVRQRNGTVPAASTCASSGDTCSSPPLVLALTHVIRSDQVVPCVYTGGIPSLVDGPAIEGLAIGALKLRRARAQCDGVEQGGHDREADRQGAAAREKRRALRRQSHRVLEEVGAAEVACRRAGAAHDGEHGEETALEGSRHVGGGDGGEEELECRDGDAW